MLSLTDMQKRVSFLIKNILLFKICVNRALGKKSLFFSVVPCSAEFIFDHHLVVNDNINDGLLIHIPISWAPHKCAHNASNNNEQSLFAAFIHNQTNTLIHT